jgi:hypothetical protein
MHCVLCGTSGARETAHVHDRCYYDCAVCRLIFMAPADRPSRDAERARYESHRNDPNDEGYRAFLARLAEPLVARLAHGASGLDYGCGPGPALSMMLNEQGFSVTCYDPFFARDESALTRRYDFITCTETVEHFFVPADEFARLDRMLMPGGWLGVMTEMRDDDRDFAAWWYVRDPTHVCFYHPATMDWISRQYRWSVHRPRRNVTLFRKDGFADVE